MTDDAIERGGASGSKQPPKAVPTRPRSTLRSSGLGAQIEELALAAAQLETTLPAKIDGALQDGLREQVKPVGRNLAESAA